MWSVTNLQPTGVVTAVADNGKSKLHPGYGMFTVTTGRTAANTTTPPPLFLLAKAHVINFMWTNCALNLLPRCVALYDLGWSDREIDTEEGN